MGRNSSIPVQPLGASSGPDQRAYRTGDSVPVTGVYGVTHAGHRLPHEVLILKDERFPRCAKCSDAVVFTLIRPVPDVPKDFSYRLFELPVLESDSVKTI